MLTRIYLALILLSVIPAWAQVEPSASGPPLIPEDEKPMRIPPLVSGEPYPNLVGSETRSNYVTTGLTFQTAYISNVQTPASTETANEVAYSVSSTTTLDQITARQHRTFTYSPRFTFYQPTNSLNSSDESADVDYKFSLSQHMTLNLLDSFNKSSNTFNQSYSLSGAPGGTQSPTAIVAAPLDDRLNNTTNIVFAYQFSRNGMIGGSGIGDELHYFSQTATSGLFDSNSRGASAFYSRRLTAAQYIGATYEYLESVSSPSDARTAVQTQTVLPFYTVYLKPKVTISVSAGPQGFQATQTSATPISGWGPALVTSLSWQGNRTNLAANYSRTVTGGMGLLGAFDSNSTNLAARWQVRRTWTVGAAGAYAINKNLTPMFALTNRGGHTVFGSFSVQHYIGGRYEMKAGYAHVHQSYGGIASISADPDSDSVYGSIAYQISKPLGR